jgi:hypothetical protein
MVVTTVVMRIGACMAASSVRDVLGRRSSKVKERGVAREIRRRVRERATG